VKVSVMVAREGERAAGGQEDLRLLDGLASGARAYRDGREYLEAMRFLGRFRSQKPYNAFLIRVQDPTACYARTATQWEREHGRRVRPDGRPLLILRPFGPIAFAYDVRDTDGERLPLDVAEPHASSGSLDGMRWERTLLAARKARIAVRQEALAVAGFASTLSPEERRRLNGMDDGLFGPQRSKFPPTRYLVRVNAGAALAERYETLVHELAHLLLGHLGSVGGRRGERDDWPNREAVPRDAGEFEAASVAYIVCSRAGLAPRAEAYLAAHLSEDGSVPPVSLDLVLSAAGTIEGWGERRSKDPRA
jgi:hypothetical protein